MSRTFYAIVYAYGRRIQNINGNRADQVYRFSTIGERTRFLDQAERDGLEADAVKASHPDVKKALRYAEQGGDWPAAV